MEAKTILKYKLHYKNSETEKHFQIILIQIPTAIQMSIMEYTETKYKTENFAFHLLILS